MYTGIPRRRIDPHAHCKTWSLPQHNKKSAMQVLVEEAKDADVCRIFDMPNIENPVTGRPVINKADVEARLKFASCQDVLTNYRTYVAATPDAKQLEEVSNMILENGYPGSFVPGIKAFMGTSVGTLGITKEDDQQIVYATLADCGYDGVLALHCEDDSKFNIKIWDPKNPLTHCLARPLEAELSSIEKNIGFARESGFNGTLLVCHLTSGDSVELLKQANKEYGLKVAAEVSPHHNLLSMEHMGPLGVISGKMNPPLRSQDKQKELFEYTKYEQKIPIMIGTDNARHPFFKKIEAPYMSGQGVEVYTIYQKLLSLIDADASVPNCRTEDLTYNNIVKVFGRKKCGA